jgi:hypothetical protein
MFFLARFLSYFLHPLLMPTYGILIIFHYNNYLRYSFPTSIILFIVLIVFLTTFILPSIASYILLKKGYIKSLQMQEKEERTLPFISTCVSYSFGYFIISKLHLPPLFNLLVLSATIAVIIAMIINLRWKISIHMIGIGGICGLIFGLSQKIIVDLRFPLILCIIVAGVLGTCRIFLNSHNPKQIYVGFIVGVVTGSVFLLL